MSARLIYRPSIPSDKNVLPVLKGGTGTRLVREAAQNLGLVTQSMVGQPFGPIPLDRQSKPAPSAMPEGYRDISMPTFSGPTEIGPEGTAVLIITNYDAFTDYDISVEGGTFRRDGPTIVFTADSVSIIGKVIVNGIEYSMPIRTPVPVTPVIDNIDLIPGSTGGVNGFFYSTDFSILGAYDDHLASDWQLSTNNTFTNIVAQAMGSTTHLTDWVVNNLTPSTTYYLRVRHHGALYVGEAWSPTLGFITNAIGQVSGVVGPDEVVVRTVASFTILGYRDDAVYTLEFSAGVTGSRTGNTVYLNAVMNTGPIWLKVNGVRKDITIIAYRPTVTGLQNVGPVEMGATRVFAIPNYVSYAVYDISISSGSTFVRQGSEITVTGSLINGPGWIEVNGYHADFLITYPVPATPSISVAAQTTQIDKIKLDLQGSAFSVSGYVGTHSGSVWELSTNQNFTDAANFVGSSSGFRDRSYSNLEPSTTYYARVRYQASTGMQSGWGMTTIQTTAWGLITGLTGNSTMMAGTNAAFVITGFQSGAPYRVTVSPGSTFVRNGDTVTFTAGTAGQSAWIEVNGVRKNLTLTYPVPVIPTVNAPNLAVVGDKIDATFSTSAFSVENNIGSHQSSDWNISIDPNFTTTVATSIGSTTNKTSWTAQNLEPQTTYYVRVRHHSSGGTVSDWAVRSFTTTAWGTVTALSGAISVEAGTTVTYTITGYQSMNPYRILVSSGSTYERYGNEVYVTIATAGTAGWVEVNGTRVNFAITYPLPSSPTIGDPAMDSVIDTVNAAFTASAFTVINNAGTHASSDWQLATDNLFANTLRTSTASTSNLTTWNVTGLAPGETYYVRVRYRSSGGAVSNWSSKAFTTIPMGNITDLSGPNTVKVNSSTVYVIEGYVDGAPYVITASPGVTFVRFQGTVTVTVPGIEAPAWIEVNGMRKTIQVELYRPVTPSVGETLLTIDAGAINANFTASPYNEEGQGEHAFTDWELARDANFTQIQAIVSVDATHLTTWSVYGLTPGTTYFLRVRYRSTTGAVSDFGVNSFTTIAYGPINGIDGSNELMVATARPYQILGYQANLVYNVSTTGGLGWSRTGDIVTVSAPGLPGAGSLTINGLTKNIQITAAKPDTPTVNAPTFTQAGLLVDAEFTASAFFSQTFGQTHVSSDWQLSKNADFAVLEKSVMDSGTDLTTWNADGLDVETNYYLRVRYKGTNGNKSDWGTLAFQTTAMGAVNGITGPAAVKTNTTTTYTIDGYEAGKLYNVEHTGVGSYTRTGATISFVSGGSVGTATFTVNGYSLTIDVNLP